jgi:hypothetical protein
VLMSDLTTIFQISYIIALCVCTFPLVLFKIWQMLLKHKKVQRPKIKSQFWRRLVQKYLILCSVNRIYYGLVIMLVWTTIGPWSFHEILDGHVGYVFLWGTFVKGQFVSSSLSYSYGQLQLTFYQLPLIMCLANVTWKRFIYGTNTQEGFFQANSFFIAVMVVEAALDLFYLIQYGFMAFLTSPIRTWSVLYGIFLFWQAHTHSYDKREVNLFL